MQFCTQIIFGANHCFAEKFDSSHETAMLYVSDHGESLGEQGMYLHGAPYVFSPREQTHVASVLWFGKTLTTVLTT